MVEFHYNSLNNDAKKYMGDYFNIMFESLNPYVSVYDIQTI